MNIKEEIKSIAFDSKGRISPKSIKSNLSLYNEIIQKTSFLDIKSTLSQRIWHILNDVYYIVKCSKCDNIVRYVNLNVGYRNFCSQKCRAKSEEVIQKQKDTCIERYGVESFTQTDIYKEKVRTTSLEKYGVEHYCQSDYMRSVLSQRKINRTEEQRNRTIEVHRKTCMERYGVSWYSKIDDFLVKCKCAWMKNLQVDHPAKSQIIIDKIVNTKQGNLLEKWPGIKQELIENGLQTDSIPKNIRENLKIVCENGHIFYRNLSGLQNNKRCPKCNNGKNTSLKENELYEFLLSNVNDITPNKRDLISPYEIDIYLPEYKLAIEFNGVYWHSESSGGKNKNYHLHKSNLCDDKEVQLIHIFENEWDNKKDIVKSILLSKIGKFIYKYYARKCYIKEIDNKAKREFLNVNHLQGDDLSSIRLGLFNGDELLSVMTFGKRKITGGEVRTELIRFCNKLNIIVIGGASKLFKYFLNHYWDGNKIVSYADRRYSDGGLYKKLGFKLSHISTPNYWYTKDYTTLFHRVGFQKHKLKDKLEQFDANLTEWQNMVNDGYDRIWDCGNYVFHYQ